MASVDLVNNDTEGEAPFTVIFRISNGTTGAGEIEVRVNSVLVDTIIVEPSSTETHSYVLDTPGQHIVQLLETVGGGGNPIDIGYVFWVTVGAVPPDDPGTTTTRTLKVNAVKAADPGAPAEGGSFQMVLLPGVGGSAVLDAITPILTSQEWTVEHAYTETIETSYLIHTNP